MIVGYRQRNARRQGGDIRVMLADRCLTGADDGDGMADNALQTQRLTVSGSIRLADRYRWRVRLSSRLDEGSRIELLLR